MSLEVTIGGGLTLPASEVFLTRTLGEPVRWRYVVAAPPESVGHNEPGRLRKALLEGPCAISPRWTGNGATKLGPDATIVAVRRTRVGAMEYLEIDGEATTVATPNPFVPRRRVHRVKNLRELFDRFSHVAQPVNALRSALERVKLPDAEHTSIVQDGVSDWQFVFRLFDQCGLVATGSPTWLPLVLVGSVDEAQGTQGRWIITPGTRRAYDEWRAVSDRTIKFEAGPERDGDQRFDFGMVTTQSAVPQFPVAQYPSAIEWRPRRAFDPGRWKTWRSMDLPRFTDPEGGLVWKIEDRMYTSRDAGLVFESSVHATPPAAVFSGPAAADPHRPWTGLGVVEESTRTGPWIKVKLGGFEGGADIVEARLGTLYSGMNGKRGFHLPPEAKTEVLLSWTGRFDQSIVCGENVRSEQAEIKALSFYLESKYQVRTAEVEAKTEGKLGLTVDRNLDVVIQQKTSVQSARQLEIKADSADLEMKNGTVYTGRGI